KGARTLDPRRVINRPYDCLNPALPGSFNNSPACKRVMQRDFISATVNRAFKQFSLQYDRASNFSVKQRGCANLVIQQLNLFYRFEKKTFDNDSLFETVFVNKVDGNLGQVARFARRAFQLDVEKAASHLDELEDFGK